jgi:hypothetical protein
VERSDSRGRRWGMGTKRLEVSRWAADKTTMSILSTPLEGLHGAESKFDRAAARLGKMGQAGPAAPLGDSIDLGTEMVNLAAARNEYEANLRSLEAGEEMTRRTLNILA